MAPEGLGTRLKTTHLYCSCMYKLILHTALSSSHHNFHGTAHVTRHKYACMYVGVCTDVAKWTEYRNRLITPVWYSENDVIFILFAGTLCHLEDINGN